VKILLDTCAFLWPTSADRKELSLTAIQLFEDPDNVILLSVASVWEIAIKRSVKKLDLMQEPSVFVQNQVRENQLSLLPISTDYALAVANLPFHHKDPFDRLLIAQALVDGIPLLSRDRAMADYGVSCLWRRLDNELVRFLALRSASPGPPSIQDGGDEEQSRD